MGTKQVFTNRTTVRPWETIRTLEIKRAIIAVELGYHFNKRQANLIPFSHKHKTAPA
jgi:hypothetical protein